MFLHVEWVISHFFGQTRLLVTRRKLTTSVEIWKYVKGITQHFAVYFRHR